ncbi:hypothetical protein [Bradyrhizobium sp. STM 3561]|uniref:hypothetical protein n=1 Tax=Bradyrhizobium sp. STM 3561 TaxID=578923 RepID=UPI00388EEAB3
MPGLVAPARLKPFRRGEGLAIHVLVLHGKARMTGTSPAMTMWRLSCPSGGCLAPASILRREQGAAECALEPHLPKIDSLSPIQNTKLLPSESHA